jgi:hypothetical protein
MPDYPRTVPEFLNDAIKMYHDKGEEYGHTYWTFGKVMEALMPGGLTVRTADDWSRLAIVNQIVGKLIRYLHCWTDPNTEELDDLGVYAFILEHIDDSIRHRNDRASGAGSGTAE